jgi:flavin-dependent dehydrogenase
MLIFFVGKIQPPAEVRNDHLGDGGDPGAVGLHSGHDGGDQNDQGLALSSLSATDVLADVTDEDVHNTHPIRYIRLSEASPSVANELPNPLVLGMTHYDCIIIGGRPAGSTLAARLGGQGLRTLLLERSPIPSLPAASSPAIYAGTMRLLEETFTADCVIGADGRFSLVARKAEAKIIDERADLPTTLYYAYWKNAEPYDDEGPCIQLYAPGYGCGFLLMDSADEALAVVVEGQLSLLEPNGQGAESLYLTLLRNQPGLYRRVARAERITEVRGMKRVGSFYCQAGGPGWALVGDALHQKDPLDGQGISDAVFTAKALSLAIGEWKGGRKSWAQAVADYDAAVRAETYPMYVETLKRVKRDLYTQYSERTMTTLIRWLADDPEYKRRRGLLLVRGIDPAQWLPGSVVYRAFARGAIDDVRRNLRFKKSSAAI